jgi:Na+/H+ antiporter NhaC
VPITSAAISVAAIVTIILANNDSNNHNNNDSNNHNNKDSNNSNIKSSSCKEEAILVVVAVTVMSAMSVLKQSYEER